MMDTIFPAISDGITGVFVNWGVRVWVGVRVIVGVRVMVGVNVIVGVVVTVGDGLKNTYAVGSA